MVSDDRYNPGHTLPHKWENAFTLDQSSWGYRRTMRIDDVLSIEVTMLVTDHDFRYEYIEIHV